MRRLGTAIAAASIATALGAGSASAAITLGATQSSNTACAAPNFVDVQTAVGPGVNSYTVPAGGGVITAWQHEARDITGALLKLKVLRRTGPALGPSQFFAVGESRFEDVSEPLSHNFATWIAVKGGDQIGLGTAANAATSPPACNVGGALPADEVYEGPDFAVGTTATLSPFNTFRLNVSATLVPCPEAGAKYCGGKKKKCKKKKKGKKGGAAVSTPQGVQAKKKCKKKKKKKKK